MRFPLARTPVALALAACLAFAVSGGGRIVGSDEVTMFEVARAMLRGSIAVPEGATLRGPDGRDYSKNTAGQAVLALPLVAVGELAAGAAGFHDEKRLLASRFVASFFNAMLSAALLAFMYVSLRWFRVRPLAALATAVALGFSTPTWIYAKSFMAEPLEALGLLLALTGAARAGEGDAAAGRWSALGVFLAVSAKLSMLPLVIVCLSAAGLRPRALAWPALGLALALAGHAGYNVARFGTPFESGYGAQASGSAFTTPLLVGLHGLLFSSGKGLAWFAPLVWLAPWGFGEMMRSRAHHDGPRHGGDVRRAAWAAIATWATGLLLFARFQHWGGDGSFGPRYLVPLLPLAFVGVGFALDGASKARKRVAWLLATAGLLVQLGGVSIYFGAQMREAGDYPYALPLEHPRFLESSRWNPAFSPIAGHWRMLGRNLGEHLRGEAPVLGQSGAVDPRLGITPGEQQALLHALDFWWLYAGYAGVPKSPLAIAAIALLLGAAWAGAAALDAAKRERP